METLAIILPIIAGGSVVCVTGLSLYFRIRHKFPVTVNCWFCNKNTDVPYGNRNCWDCPHCEQYNGFFPDGSYNKAIPAQHDELLNHPVQAVSNKVMRQKLAPTEPSGNGLCRKCNINQELKVQQLAAFTPVNPAHYDEEVNQFRHHLERAYRLCSPCEEVLMKTLNKQKCMFLGIRLEQSRNSILLPKNGFLSRYVARLYQAMPSRLHMTCYFTTLLAAALVLASSYHLSKDEIPIPEVIRNQTIWSYVPSLDDIFPHSREFLLLLYKYEIILTAAGALMQLIAIPARRHKNIDFLCAGFWLLLHIQCWLAKWRHLEKYISLLDFNIIHVAVNFTTLLMCTCSALVQRQRFEPKCYSTPRRVRNLNSSSESFNTSCNSEDISVTPLQDCHQFKDVRANEKVSPAKFVDKQGMPLHSKLSRFVPLSPSVKNRNIEQHVACGQDNSSDDLDCGLGKLTLGTKACDKLVEEKRISPSFKTKIYGQNICDSSFDGGPYANLRNRKQPLIKPSQLNLCKNITQSSWVAGGYWQNPTHGRVICSPKRETQGMPPGNDFVPLSRSSSQSSGFVSQSSQTDLYDGVATSLPNSRTGSICGGDFDRFSALSEPIYHYATTPVYYANGRPAPFFGAPFYGATPLLVPHPFGMVPPGFVSNYPIPQPRPALAHAQAFYHPQPPRPLSAIWNPSAFSSSPNKSHNYTYADVQSQSSSENSNENQALINGKTKNEHNPSPKQRTLISAIKENMFLAVLFCCSLLFNALILGGVMLGNSNLMLPRVV